VLNFWKTLRNKKVKYRQKVPGIFAVHMNRQRFLSIFYTKNQEHPEKKKRVKYRQEVPEIFSGHMNRQRFLIKMS
jgi:hypothetical protein